MSKLDFIKGELKAGRLPIFTAETYIILFALALLVFGTGCTYIEMANAHDVHVKAEICRGWAVKE